MALYLASLWNRGLRQLGNGLLEWLLQDYSYIIFNNIIGTLIV